MNKPFKIKYKSGKDLDISSVFFMNEIFNNYPGHTVIITPLESSGECTILNEYGKEVSYSSSVDLSDAVIGAVQGFLIQNNMKFNLMYQQETES